MNYEEAIPISEYARQNQCNRNIIYRAIQSGLIPEKAIIFNAKKRPFIISSIADEFWGNDYRGTKEIQKYDSVKVRKTKNRPLIKTASFVAGKKEKVKPDEIALDLEGMPIISKDMSLKDAIKANEILEAIERQMKIRKTKGELVEKDTVYKSLFQFGQTIRAKIESIPERYIDEIISATSRNKAYQVLTKAINEALQELTTKPKIN